MAYTKTNWVNGQTPINADNLNKMEEGIANAVNIVKLWENASPTSSFEPQTLGSDVLADLPINYDLINIVCNSNIANTYKIAIIIPSYDNNSSAFILNHVYGNNNKILGRYRGGTVNADSILLKSGYETTPSTDAVDNSMMVPTQIYGIKGVK